MHARSTDDERYIEPIVDEERHAERGEERAGRRGELAGAGMLEPQLHGGDAAAFRRLAERHEVPTPDEGVVGDQHQPQDFR